MGNKLKKMDEALKPALKRLNKLDESKRISKGKNKIDAPNKNDLKEYLDVAIPLEDVENDLCDILIDLHPNAEHIKSMPLTIMDQQQQIDALQQDINEYKEQINALKIKQKLNKIHNDNDDEDDTNTNPYKLQFAGIYKKVSQNFEENKDSILSELRSIISNIGNNLNKKQDANELSMDSIAANTNKLYKEYKSLH